MTDEQTAAAIVADPMNAVSETAMEAAIVRALQAARDEAGRDGVVAGHMTRKAPPGHIIDDAGVVRRVYCKTPGYGFWKLDEAAEAAKEAKK